MDDADSPPDVPVPADPEGWRTLIAAIPARELFRLLQEDKLRAHRVLSGFRGTPDTLRHPVVLSRLIQEATKQPQFARDLAGWAPVGAAPRAAGDGSGPPAPAIPASPAEVGRPDPRLKEKLKDQRAALREKDERIAALEAALAEAQRQCDAARAEADAARGERKAAEALADRLRRRQERDTRRANAVSTAPGGETSPRARATPRETVTAPAPPAPVWEEALGRLASRGKHELVAKVSREALAAGGEGLASLHALYAAALYAQGHAERAAEQDRQAVEAYLNRGDVAAAAESFARALPYAAKGGDAALLRRLLALAERTGQKEVVHSTFARLRAAGGEAYRRLGETVASLGAPFAGFLRPPQGPTVGPDETISLPTGGIDQVTPRRLARAVDAGDAPFVSRARGGIAALRAANEPLADALLEAVAALHPAAVVPLTEATRPVVVDASNVARHDPDPLALSPLPRIAHLLKMRDFLLRRGFFPVVMLADANLRFHVDDREAYLALIERGVVREAPPGTTADAALIAEARERAAPLVTNDRLWEWEEARDIERLGFGIFPNGVSFASF